MITIKKNKVRVNFGKGNIVVGTDIQINRSRVVLALGETYFSQNIGDNIVDGNIRREPVELIFDKEESIDVIIKKLEFLKRQLKDMKKVTAY